MSTYRNNCNVLLSLSKSAKAPAEKLVLASATEFLQGSRIFNQGDASTAEAKDLSSIKADLGKGSEI